MCVFCHILSLNSESSHQTKTFRCTKDEFCLIKRICSFIFCFFSANCDSISLIADFQSKQVQQLFSQLLPHCIHCCCCCTLPGFFNKFLPSKFPLCFQTDNIICNQQSSQNVNTCKSVLIGFHPTFVSCFDGVSQFCLAVLHKQDSSTLNLIYQEWRLLMQSLKTASNSITKRLAPGRSLFRDQQPCSEDLVMSWRGFTSGNIIYVPEPLCFSPLNPLRTERPLVW